MPSGTSMTKALAGNWFHLLTIEDFLACAAAVAAMPEYSVVFSAGTDLQGNLDGSISIDGPDSSVDKAKVGNVIHKLANSPKIEKYNDVAAFLEAHTVS